MPTPTIPNGRAYVAANLWTGTGSAQTISNADLGTTGFQPDFIWYKARSNGYNNALQDSIRGTSLVMISNNTSGDLTDTQDTTAFNTNGFNIGTSSSVNGSGVTYVGWQWKAGGTAVTNTAGSITSQVSANTTSGFSVVTYTGNGTAGATIGHGLGIAPSIMIFKGRNTASSWLTWSIAYGSNQAQMLLDSTAAIYNPGNGLYFNSTYPSSTVATLGTSGSINGSGTTYVAYMWAPVAGYSAFGSYTGNGSTDGPFVYTGFRPRFLLTKRSDAIESWRIGDSSRSPYNAVQLELFANLSNAEENNSNQIDYLSNGFKIRTSSSSHNASGGTYIYMAFAENPFKYANAR